MTLPDINPVIPMGNSNARNSSVKVEILTTECRQLAIVEESVVTAGMSLGTVRATIDRRSARFVSLPRLSSPSSADFGQRVRPLMRAWTTYRPSSFWTIDSSVSWIGRG